MLHLQLIYVQLGDPLGEITLEFAGGGELPLRRCSRVRSARGLTGYWETIPSNGPRGLRSALEAGMSMTLRLGLYGEMGMLVAGAERPDFPGQTEEPL